jgi:hypothetical protein
VIGFVLAVAIASLRADVALVSDESRVARTDMIPTHPRRTAPA